jgi:hypothetical protein
MSWVTFKTRGGGLLKVRTQHIVSIYDELGEVKLSTASGGVHTLESGNSVQQAAASVSDAAERENDRE